MAPLHILVLTDRDWTHPQGGGTGANLYGQVSRWVDWGHRVSVVACGYEGAAAREQIGNVSLYRIGGRSTVFPRAIWRQWRGLVPDADVVLEVVNGITFLTPLWLRTPRVTLIHHVHRRHYVEEMGRAGVVAGLLLERLPLSMLYRGSRFLTISEASADEIAELGIPRERIEVGYIGVEAAALGPGRRAPEPTLLFLGRLKGYKRVELLLDVIERIPEAVLEIAGDGDHRPEIEHAIRARGLERRVRLHGTVTEAHKLELLQSAWVNVTASAAEGWCLTVMEAACCRTPSVALAVGGVRESIDDGRTGLLAGDLDELAEKAARVVRDPGLRERLGTAAYERAQEFTWDRTARQTLDLLERQHAERTERAPGLRKRMADSGTMSAAGLAAAVMASNVVALVFTVVFARLLGASGYGSLAALLSAFIILMVPGSALQIAVAREISVGTPSAAASVRHWLSRIAVVAVAVAAVAIASRDVLAAVLNVDEAWAAAAVPVCSLLWMVVSVERGALQGYRRYRLVGASIVGEALSRLLLGVALVLAGLGVTGAFLATPLSLAAIALVLARPLVAMLPERRERRPLRELLGGAWIPVVGLTLLFALQEVHVIVVKHEVADELAGSYAVAAVAAKAIIWVAVGLGMYLLPEAARRADEGVDARPVLVRTLALIATAALPMVALYAIAAAPLLRLVFGADLAGAAGALPWLGLAMALLACAYLSVQYLLALRCSSFVWVLAAGAMLEVVLLAVVGADLTAMAMALLALQVVCAGVVLTLSLRASPARGLAR